MHWIANNCPGCELCLTQKLFNHRHASKKTPSENFIHAKYIALTKLQKTADHWNTWCWKHQAYTCKGFKNKNLELYQNRKNRQTYGCVSLIFIKVHGGYASCTLKQGGCAKCCTHTQKLFDMLVKLLKVWGKKIKEMQCWWTHYKVQARESITPHH